MSAEGLTPEEREAHVNKIAKAICAKNQMPSQLWECFLADAWGAYLAVDHKAYLKPTQWSIERDNEKGDAAK